MGFFQENNIEFTEIDVTTDESGRDEMVEKSGGLAVPVVDIDGTIIVGFDQPKIKELLKIP